jgi:NAD(P)H-dependent FMN reductase
MKLLLINGSPRNRKSNSHLLIQQFLEGYGTTSPEQTIVHHLASRRERQQLEEEIGNYEVLLIVFPLYTDSMPGIVKELFEKLAELKPVNLKKIGFIVQSGFPEAIHSVYVERYLKKYSQRLDVEYLGTIIKGGVEGIQVMPPAMTKKLFNKFQALGRYFAENQTFSPEIKADLRKPMRFSATRVFFFRLLVKAGMTNYYWNSHLKKYNAFEKRFARPYQN